MIDKCYKYNIKDIDENKWTYRIKEDTNNFRKKSDCFSDKIGIIGDKIFDLTLDNQSSNLSYRDVPVSSGELVAKGTFNALCPELESFVTLITWMGSKDKRNSKRVKSFQELQKFFKEKDSLKVCRIIGNFRIKSEEFSTILPYYSNIQIQDKDVMFYEWERVPFLKRSGETLSCFPSPIFMSTIPSTEKYIPEEKVAYFSAILKVKNVKNNILTADFFNCTSAVCEEMELSVYDNDLLNKLKHNLDVLFIGLLEDKILKKKNSYFREFVLLKISEELDGNDIAAHLLIQRMYYNYLSNQKLFICSNKDFEDRLRRIFYQTETSYLKKVTMQLDFFIKSYLESYFIKINNSWYYKPFILKALTPQEFIEFIQYLDIKESDDKLWAMGMSIKYKKYGDHLNFLNLYNFYSKRTLIDIIKKQNYENGTSKWRIQIQ